MRNQLAFLGNDSIVLVSLVDGQFAPNVDIMASCTAGTTQIYRGDYIYTVDTRGTKIWTLVGPNTIHPARRESSVSVALDLVQRTLPPSILHLEFYGYAASHSTIIDITGPITVNGMLISSWTTAPPDVSGVDVSGVDVSGVDVSGVDVSGVDVSGVDVGSVVTYASPSGTGSVTYVWTTDGSGNPLLSPSVTTRAPYVPYYPRTSIPIPPPTTLPRHVVNLLLDKAIAEEVVCPITGELIQSNAAVTSCGHIFDRAALTHWLSANRTCPTCRAVCSSS
jgi:hypothetical protein